MGRLPGVVALVASLTLVSGCSLLPPRGAEQEAPPTVTVEAEPSQETRTVTRTESADGSWSEDEGPEQAVEDFGQAVQDEDFWAMCDAFDPEFVRTVESAGQDCASMFEENWDEMGEDIPEDAEMDVRDSELDGDTATVTVMNDEGEEQDINLTKIDGDWKISLDTM